MEINIHVCHTVTLFERLIGYVSAHNICYCGEVIEAVSDVFLEL